MVHRKSYIESDLSKYDAGRKLSNAGKLYEYDMSAQTSEEAYYKGEKSAEETAALIQSVSFAYVSEIK